VKDVPGTLVFYETAPRLVGSLVDMKEILGDREAAVTRELTKKFEEVRRDRLSALVAH
jgi:16S rRNA (cytidine1402-2'-O)-methyltransferase